MTPVIVSHFCSATSWKQPAMNFETLNGLQNLYRSNSFPLEQPAA